MSERYLTKGLLIAALYLASHVTALASSCGDAARNYNRTANSVDNWYLAAFERVTGLPASSRITTDVCPRLLPILRERLRRHRTVLEAYRVYQNACANPRINVGERDGIKIASPPVVLRAVTAHVQMCEQAVPTTEHARLNVNIDVGARSCTNQLGRCISYRRAYGPAGSEGVCSSVYRACLRSGVWDATSAFPYGGARITGMIRR